MKKSLSFETASIVMLLLLGFILRFRQYLTLRSLWADEAMLALNIVNRGFAELLKPLDYNQGAPIGFLLTEKFFNLLLGRHELALRLFPFLAGLISLWLVYLLLRRLTQPAGLFMALALFAVNPQLIYYSSESKQYIIDVAVTLALLVIALPFFQARARKQDYVLLGLGGILALWFSHPALFVLAGIGLALLMQFVQRRDLSNVRLMIFLGMLWLFNLAFLYSLQLRNLSTNGFLINYWKDAFIPMPLWSHLDWFLTSYRESIKFQFGIEHIPWLVWIVLLAGWLVLYQEMQLLALAFALIPLSAVIAAVLTFYPIQGRLTLFMIPLGIVLLGKAVEGVQKVFAPQFKAAITVALSVYLLYGPAATSLQNFVSPKYFEHIRPYMDYLSAAWQDEDVLFISYWAEPAFQFYAPFYGLDEISYKTTEYEDYSSPQELKLRLESFIGQKRTWVLFSHVYEQAGFNEKDFLIGYLDDVGKKIREFHRPNTSVYLFLYDLSRAP